MTQNNDQMSLEILQDLDLIYSDLYKRYKSLSGEQILILCGAYTQLYRWFSSTIDDGEKCKNADRVYYLGQEIVDPLLKLKKPLSYSMVSMIQMTVDTLLPPDMKSIKGQINKEIIQMFSKIEKPRLSQKKICSILIDILILVGFIWVFIQDYFESIEYGSPTSKNYSAFQILKKDVKVYLDNVSEIIKKYEISDMVPNLFALLPAYIQIYEDEQ